MTFSLRLVSHTMTQVSTVLWLYDFVSFNHIGVLNGINLKEIMSSYSSR